MGLIMRKFVFLILILVIRGLKFGLKITGHKGTSAPGVIIEKYFPSYLKEATMGYKEIIVISGTNGKTTTKQILNSLYNTNGISTVSNKEGANIYRGVATALFNNLSITGKIKHKYAILEVEEATLPKLSLFVKIDKIILTNIFRDQLDVYGEIDTTLNYFTTTIKNTNPKIYINWDDKKLLSCIDNNREIYGFSVQNNNLKYEEYTNPNNTNTPKKINIAKQISDSDTQIFELNDKQYLTNLTGLYNLYNVLAAGLVAQERFGEIVWEQIKDIQTAFGRGEKILLFGKEIKLFLVKNPAGMEQVLHLINSSSNNKNIILITNDNIADGKDVSWYWDVDLENIIDINKVEKIYTSGTRALDMMLRLKYAGNDHIKDHNIIATQSDVLNIIKNLDGEIYVLCTYTALLEFYKSINKSI